MGRGTDLVQDAMSVLLKIGCWRVPSRTIYPAPRAPLPNEFVLGVNDLPPVQEIRQDIQTTTDAYTRQDILLEIGVTHTMNRRPVGIECYMPRTVKVAPVVVILPILDDKAYLLERYFARYFAKRGFAALIVERVRSELITDGKQINSMLVQAVCDSCSVLSWIQTRKEFAAGQIAVFGVSLGGINGMLLAAIDQRVRVAALGLVGGDLPSILRYSQDGAWRGGGITKRREEYLKRNQITPEEFESELRKNIRWNPLFLAPSVNPEKVLLILARCDRVIPFEQGLKLWRAMQKPETLILASGHYSAMVYLPYLRRAIVEFFARNLGLS